MAQDPKMQPDWRPFRAMLRYIDEYPERLHHPKEDQFLFARLAKRSADARKLIDDLKSEHVQGARLIRDLERAFLFTGTTCARRSATCCRLPSALDARALGGDR